MIAGCLASLTCLSATHHADGSQEQIGMLRGLRPERHCAEHPNDRPDQMGVVRHELLMRPPLEPRVTPM
jgi:hypothetical protein